MNGVLSLEAKLSQIQSELSPLAAELIASYYIWDIIGSSVVDICHSPKMDQDSFVRKFIYLCSDYFTEEDEILLLRSIESFELEQLTCNFIIYNLANECAQTPNQIDILAGKMRTLSVYTRHFIPLSIRLE